MTLYVANSNSTSTRLKPLTATSFEERGLDEPNYLRPLLKNSIGKVDGMLDDIMIVAEEFNEWKSSNRRVDLLAVDQKANLVVIEVKKTSHGDHAELQSIRYAAMISKITFDKIVEVYQGFMEDNGIDGDARDKLMEFFGWNEVDENLFGQEVKIVIASAGFSDELATSVIWLRNTCDLDIRCMKMEPWLHGEDLLIDANIVIPVPGTEDIDFKSSEKKQKERQSTSKKDFSRYDVSVNGVEYGRKKAKNHAMHALIKALVNENKCSPQEIDETLAKMNLFYIIPYKLNAASAYEHVTNEISEDKAKRFFCRQDDDILHHDGKTYLVTNGWQLDTLEYVVEELKTRYPELDIKVVNSDERITSSEV